MTKEFRCQVSAQPLAADAASLIEKEILSCGVYKKANIECRRNVFCLS
jgi:hypothetical protein